MTDFYTNGRGMPKFLRQKLLQTITPFYSWRTALLVLVFVCFQFVCLAQESRDNGTLKATESIKPLEIGDEIPEELWLAPLQVVNHPEGKEVVTLDEYRGKLIILDFWSTWCSSCIKGFPKVEELQNEFAEEVKILAVTNQELPVITEFFESSIGDKYSYLNSVVNDDLLLEFFPHLGVPHLVWIGQDGKLISTTSISDFNKKNIQAIVNQRQVELERKVDVDREKPLFLSDNLLKDDQLGFYSILIKGFYPGLPSGNKIKKNKEGIVYRRQMTNFPLMMIFEVVLRELFDDLGELFQLNKVVCNVERPELLNQVKKPDGFFDESNLYSYELIVPEDRADSLFYYMLSDLNRYLNYNIRIEKQLADCLVLIRTSSSDKIKTSNEKSKITYSSPNVTFRNTSINTVINHFSELKFIDLPIIDETDYSNFIDLELISISDLPSLKKELNRYDLDLVSSKKLITVAVIEDLY